MEEINIEPMTAPEGFTGRMQASQEDINRINSLLFSNMMNNLQTNNTAQMTQDDLISNITNNLRELGIPQLNAIDTSDNQLSLSYSFFTPRMINSINNDVNDNNV